MEFAWFYTWFNSRAEAVQTKYATASVIRTIALTLLLLPMAAPLKAASEALTLAEALQLASSRSQQLVAQDAAARAARHMAIAAGQLPDPTLKLGITNLPINGEDRFSLGRDFMTMRSVGIMQEFTGEDKRRARADRFEEEAQTATAGRTLALANLQRNTAQAWLNLYYQAQIRRLLTTQRDEAKLQIEAADTAYRTGRGSQADVFAARSAVAQIEDRIAQSERELATANTRLARWVGTAVSRISDALPSMDTTPLNGDVVPALLAQHPELVLLERQEQVAVAEVDVAKANKKSDWTAELMFNQRGTAYSNMVSINFSVPLQWAQTNRQDREQASKQATVEQLHALREEASRGLLADIRAIQQEWQSNRARIVHFDSSQIPLTRERIQAALVAYGGGGGSLTAVLEARRMALDTRLERIRLEMETAMLWATLHYLMPVSANLPAQVQSSR